ncbi:MAG: RNA polymerase recycling motor HelD [Clostridia bacterium]
MSILDEEKRYLSKTNHIVATQIKQKTLLLKSDAIKYKSDIALRDAMLVMHARKLRNLNAIKDRPYFARIDFKENGGDELTVYLGKTDLINEDESMQITDWRAPIASIYYDTHTGNISYNAPQGITEGNLKLKRQIIIENKEIVDVIDAAEWSNDEMLRPYLSSNADNRLKNIVATIQNEQNEIIRRPMFKDCIVEGVAGSGKTTVALHKIAYLVYTYQDQIMPNQYMVIGPNKFFINYISSVLPDLDVGDVAQNTYEELAKEYIGEKFKIRKQSEKIKSVMEDSNLGEDSKLKLSMTFKKAIDKYLIDFEKSIILGKNLSMENVTIVSEKTLLDIYMQYKKDIYINTKIDKCQKAVITKIQNKKDIYSDKVREVFMQKTRGLPELEKRKIFAQRNKVIAEVNLGCKNILKQVFTETNIKPLKVYTDFIENIEKYIDTDTKNLKEETLINIDKKVLDFEDIPALIYIKYRLSGSEKYKKIMHVVVDEAQDYGAFNMYALKKIFKSSTFTVFGDTAQSIYGYRSIENFEQMKDEVFTEECEILKLKKSYRTTKEIMYAANHITKKLGLTEAIPVIRTGSKVKLKTVTGKEKIQFIKESIDKFLKENNKSIAVICKTEEEAKKISKELEIIHITEDSKKYEDGVIVLTAHLAKGLEFDSVIIDAADTYSEESTLEMKLLYVAMTRALHNLILINDNEINNVIKDMNLEII